MSQIDRSEGLVGNTGLKAPVKAASTANLTLSGEQTIDGVSCVEGDRILAKDQTTASENGIYTVSTGTWTRAADFDGSYDISQGTLITVANGTVNSNLIYQITTADPITIGTTSLTFAVNNTASVAASGIHGATSKTTPTGADEFGIVDSAASFALKKLTFTNLVTYLSGLCSAEWNALTATTAVALTNTSGQIPFPATYNPSANVNTLDDYDEYTAASTACTGALTVSVVWSLTKIGNVVTLLLPQTVGTTTAAAYFDFGLALPVKYRPATSVYHPAVISDNGVFYSSVIVVINTGVIRVYRNLNLTTNFGTSANSGLTGLRAISWTV